MFYIKIADLLVEIDNRYESIEEKCKDYIARSNREPDIRIKTTDKFLNDWIYTLEEHNILKKGWTRDDNLLEWIESTFLHWEIYSQLPKYNAGWIHACLVDVDGKGYVFTAPSGYGKTTQSRMWLKYFGNRARIINGDNPIIRIVDDKFYAYGTPFCGSEGYNVNTSVPLKGICYLNHSNINHIERMEPAMAFAQMLAAYQFDYLIKNDNQEYVVEVLEKMAECIPFWQLYCDISLDAVEIAYNGMNN